MAKTQAKPKRRSATEENRRLIEEFRARPVGHHSADLQRIINKLRGSPMAGKYCLVTVKPHKQWQLAQTSGVRGKPLKMLNKKFTSLETAEWHVFKLRWKEHTGETLR
jgi:hypothetical protein